MINSKEILSYFSFYEFGIKIAFGPLPMKMSDRTLGRKGLELFFSV